MCTEDAFHKEGGGGGKSSSCCSDGYVGYLTAVASPAPLYGVSWSQHVSVFEGS